MSDEDDEIVVVPMSADATGNNVVATGALFALLNGLGARRARVLTFVEIVAGAGNQLVVGFDFLGLPYRITVEQIVGGWERDADGS